MRFPEIVYIAGFLVAALATASVMPLVIRVCAKMGLVDDPGGRKTHSRPTPLAGGLGVFTGLVLTGAIGALALSLHVLEPSADSRLEYGLSHRLPQLIGIGCGAAAMLSLGLIDDRYELSAALKLFG